MTAIEFNTALVAQQQGLKNFALSLTSDREEAQDLLQDTFMKALLYKDKFVQSTNLKAWLYMIMKNTFINAYRRSVKTREIMSRSKDVSSLGITKNNQKNTAEAAIEHKEINHAIDTLEDEYKVPFKRFYDGFKYKEIAEELDLPIGTVKSRIFIARKKLMEELKDYEN
jgi:RNA polymerase sigma-70 factor (ECF subfamily)